MSIWYDDILFRIFSGFRIFPEFSRISSDLQILHRMDFLLFTWNIVIFISGNFCGFRIFLQMFFRIFIKYSDLREWMVYSPQNKCLFSFSEIFPLHRSFPDISGIRRDNCIYKRSINNFAGRHVQSQEMILGLFMWFSFSSKLLLFVLLFWVVKKFFGWLNFFFIEDALKSGIWIRAAFLWQTQIQTSKWPLWYHTNKK